jgi:hypothetical protein
MRGKRHNGNRRLVVADVVVDVRCRREIKTQNVPSTVTELQLVALERFNILHISFYACENRHSVPSIPFASSSVRPAHEPIRRLPKIAEGSDKTRDDDKKDFAVIPILAVLLDTIPSNPSHCNLQ